MRLRGSSCSEKDDWKGKKKKKHLIHEDETQMAESTCDTSGEVTCRDIMRIV